MIDHYLKIVNENYEDEKTPCGCGFPSLGFSTCPYCKNVEAVEAPNLLGMLPDEDLYNSLPGIEKEIKEIKNTFAYLTVEQDMLQREISRRNGDVDISGEILFFKKTSTGMLVERIVNPVSNLSLQQLSALIVEARERHQAADKECTAAWKRVLELHKAFDLAAKAKYCQSAEQ